MNILVLEDNPVSMKVTFLGTNGWYDSPTGNTCSVLVQSAGYDIIFDAGNGIAKADRYITGDKPVYLFLSHFHLDHIIGLHTLVKLGSRNGLYICIQAGSRDLLSAFVAEPFTVPLTRLPYPVTIVEMGEGEQPGFPFPVLCLPLVHPAPCFGFRLILDGKVISYCTDTGPCGNAVSLGRDADLLITECGLKPGTESPEWPHLNPEMAIAIAKEAHARRLALIHFSPELYRTLDDRRELLERFTEQCPGLVVATDDLMIDV